jgi:hypothetical protein
MNKRTCKDRTTTVQTRIHRILAASIVAGIASFAAGCSSTGPEGAAKEVDVTISDVYDVEATVGGRHLEYLIDAGDGKILGTEVPVEFSALPGPVQEAVEKYFGTTSGLVLMKGVEYGETHYEIEGPKNGKTVEVTFDSKGKRGN